MKIIRFALPAAFVLLLASCQDEITRSQIDVPAQRPVEGEVRTGWIMDSNGRAMKVTFEVIEGRAILEGDIDLGPAESIASTPDAAVRPDGPRYGVIRNGASNWWWNGDLPYSIVHYSIDPSFDALQRQTIVNAMGHVQSVNPGLQFYPSSSGGRIHFRLSSSLCSSPIGRQGGVQDINLTAGCAYDMGSVAHEVLHSLGMRHEQARCDRDNYVRINTQNIMSGSPITSTGTAPITPTSERTTRRPSCTTVRTPSPPTGYPPSNPCAGSRT